jgi:hypothetical protein
MSKLLSVAAICTLAAAPLSPVWAASCTSLNIKGFSEGDVVYRDRSEGTWKEVKSVSRIAKEAGSLRGTTRFYYIAKGKPDQPGILVIKTARTPKLTANGNSTANRSKTSVRMERKRYEEARGNRGCIAGSRLPFRGDVAGATYDGYHDYGYDKGDGLQLIKKFHLRYVNRDGDCDATDNPYNTRTSYWPFGSRIASNRSQFSFDKSVVGTGMFAKTAGWIPSAYASWNLYDRHVVMEPYTISDDKTACVPFHLTIRQDTILRIVDIEARRNGNRLPERER